MPLPIKYNKRRANKRRKSYSLQDMYVYYKETNAICKEYNIPYSLYSAICSEFNIYARNSVLHNVAGIKLFHKIGKIIVKKYKFGLAPGQYFALDYKKSKELDTTVRILNEHSSGFRYRIAWKIGDLDYGYAYTFKPCRDFKRMLAQIIFNKEMDYLVL